MSPLSVVIMPSFRRGRRSYRRRRSRVPTYRLRSRRYFPRLRKRFRKRRSGNITLLAKQVQSIVVTNQADVLLPIVVSYRGLTELVPFDSLFEAYRFWSVKVKVIPNFNITDAAEATTPPYYSAPYHKGVPDLKVPESILTIDRSRSHHACSQSNRTFVPATVVGVETRAGGSGAKGTDYSMTRYRPKIEFMNNESTDVQHYCGFYVFPKNTGGTESRMYTVITTVKCTLYNQSQLS